MKVILTNHIKGVGKKGDIKEVSDGFAKNFLIAKGFAQVATVDMQNRLNKEAKEQEAKKQKQILNAQSLKQDLEKRIFIVKVKVGAKGQIFGAVHEKEIVVAVNGKLATEFEKSQVEILTPIKTLGEHTVKIKLAPGVLASVKINVEAL
jgi:large subunit ribosomal protein L9